MSVAFHTPDTVYRPIPQLHYIAETDKRIRAHICIGKMLLVVAVIPWKLVGHFPRNFPETLMIRKAKIHILRGGALSYMFRHLNLNKTNANVFLILSTQFIQYAHCHTDNISVSFLLMRLLE